MNPILIIDDDPIIRQMVEMILNEEGYTAIKAVNGLKGLEMFEKEKPPIVITDIKMPGVDGMQVLAEIKKTRPETEVIVITGHGEINLAIQALQMEASDFIQKPFGFEALTVAVKRAHDKIRVRETLAETQVQLLQAEKMASLGQLAAGIAHEVNNPIAFINSNLNSFQKYAAKIEGFLNALNSLFKNSGNELSQTFLNLKKENNIDFIINDMKSLLDESIEGTQRVKHIVQDLREFSHIDTKKLTYYNINDGVNSTLNIIRNELINSIEIRKNLGDIPQMLCYPQQINQAILNLLMNSIEAIESAGTIKIDTLTEDRGICLKISDNGAGIPKAIIDKIFDPFFTTKEVGRGTGLGLHIVYSIVKTHGGEINVVSHVGKGTTFNIHLPLIPPVKEDDE